MPRLNDVKFTYFINLDREKEGNDFYDFKILTNFTRKKLNGCDYIPVEINKKYNLHNIETIYFVKNGCYIVLEGARFLPYETIIEEHHLTQFYKVNLTSFQFNDTIRKLKEDDFYFW
jgi:hypothetical protein